MTLPSKSLMSALTASLALVLSACGGSTLATGDTATASVGDECANDVEVEQYSLADESRSAPVEWRNQNVEGTVTRIDDSTISFMHEGIELIRTSGGRNLDCAIWPGE